jgi:hypothetical protein
MNNMRDRYGIRGRDMVGVIPGDFADDVSVDSELF